MKKYAVMAVVAVMGLAACSEGKFHVEGNIDGAKDSVLYLEQVGISDISVLDSVRLDEGGKFAFSGDRQEAPEFYRLRISDQIINIAIDSTETVTVKASYPQMATQYEVSGSENCQKIKELALRQIALQQQVVAISEDETLGTEAATDSILSVVERYKDEVKRQYIFPNPDKSYAYFALFQALGDMLIFNPRTNKDDIKVFAAVATSWDTYYPNAERGSNLHNIAIEGMKNVRINEAANAKTIDASKIQTTGLIDIALADNKGTVRRLTDLKGRVVLLDFHVFATDDSPARILLLRELYNKYHARGLEIYQVSLDTSEHYWKTMSDQLPWVCVWNSEGLQNDIVRIYNLQTLPTWFLIDRGSNLVGRMELMEEDLEHAIARLL